MKTWSSWSCKSVCQQALIKVHYYLICKYNMVFQQRHTDIKPEVYIHFYNSFFLKTVVGVVEFL